MPKVSAYRIFYYFAVNHKLTQTMKRIFLIIAIVFVATTIQAQVKVDINNNLNSAPQKRNAVTVGILNGGGALIGADYERLFTNRIGLQAGIGFAAYGFGINYHLKPAIESSFINLAYWHQGFVYSFTQSVVGVSFVYRARRLLQAQIGVGFQTDYNSSLISYQPVMLMYALGIYLPF